MHPIMYLGVFRVPTYGVLGFLAMATVFFGGIIILICRKLPVFDGIVLGTYGIIGALLGAKGLYIIEQLVQIRFTTEIEWRQMLLSGGSAYGGVVAGLGAIVFAGKLHKIDVKRYSQNLLFLLPLAHGIWKIGCHFAGCCYGIAYDGVGCLHFPVESYAIYGIPLFPVQMLEVILLICLSVYVCLKKITIFQYMAIYSVIRFLIEFLRNSDNKLMIGILSDVQLMGILIAFGYTITAITNRRKNERTVR